MVWGVEGAILPIFAYGEVPGYKKKKEPVSILYCLTICQACFNKLILHKNYKLYQKRF